MLQSIRYTHREAWLAALTDSLRPWFEEQYEPLPDKVRVSCGFPSRGALNGKNQNLGQCWYSPQSKGGYVEIFISPVVADTLRVADILAHELCHAACGPDVGHKGPFKELARQLGLVGNLTSTVGGELFRQLVQPFIDDLGPYPHGELDACAREPKKQGTRPIKVSCPACGYKVNISRKWLDEAGAPLCPIHEAPLEEDQ